MLPIASTVAHGNSYYSFFADGSNLWLEQMKTRLGDLRNEKEWSAILRPCVATLPHHRLNFSMIGSHVSYYANVVPDQGEVLEVIYQLNSRTLEIFDAVEALHLLRTSPFQSKTQLALLRLRSKLRNGPTVKHL